MGKGDIEHSETLRRKRRAFQARVYESKSFAAIGEELGVSPMTAHNWVSEMRHVMLPPQEEEELRQIDVAKIDASEATAHMAREMLRAEGNRRIQLGKDVTDVVESLRRWDQRLSELRQERAKLLGLNKPVKVHHKHTITTDFDEEIEDLVSLMAGGGTILTNPDEFEEVDDDATSYGK